MKVIKRWVCGQDCLVMLLVNGKYVKDKAQLLETKDGLKDNEVRRQCVKTRQLLIWIGLSMFDSKQRI